MFCKLWKITFKILAFLMLFWKIRFKIQGHQQIIRARNVMHCGLFLPCWIFIFNIFCLLDTFEWFCLTYVVFMFTINAVVIIFQVKNTFSPVHQNHYLFTPRDLTRWCLGFLRYDLKEDEQSVNLVLEVSALAYSLFCMNFIYTYWIFWRSK